MLFRKKFELNKKRMENIEKIHIEKINEISS